MHFEAFQLLGWPNFVFQIHVSISKLESNIIQHLNSETNQTFQGSVIGLNWDLMQCKGQSLSSIETLFSFKVIFTSREEVTIKDRE